MVTPRSNAKKASPEVIAEYIVRALLRTTHAAVSAVVFLSGGQIEHTDNHLTRSVTQSPIPVSSDGIWFELYLRKVKKKELEKSGDFQDFYTA
ncbi:hypothetical protein ACFX15_020703 [Malus domestica]|uniref:fructose-bisphosphate aldolase n=1 Tax=Malus domestica TaxID=3750 RepID=A0A498HR86_MALDO|nr:hypothetical protein DVH24_033663 [Malus domestica]